MYITRRQFIKTASAAVGSILLPTAVFPSEKRNISTGGLKMMSLSIYDTWQDREWEMARIVGIGPSGVAAVRQLQKSLSRELMAGDLYTCRISDVNCHKYPNWLVVLMDDREGSFSRAEEIISRHKNSPDILITTLCLAGNKSMSEGIKSFVKMPGTTILIPENTDFQPDGSSNLLSLRADLLLKLFFAQITPGLVFSEFKTALNASKKAMSGVGEASGKNRAIIAAERAVKELRHQGLDLKNSPSSLVHISGSDCAFIEVESSMTHILKHLNADAFIAYSMTCDETVEYRVTVFAGIG